MNCDDIRPLLTSYQLDELIPREHKAVRKHVDSCDHCRAESEEIHATLSLLDEALAAPQEIARQLSPERRAAVFDAVPKSSWVKQWRILELAAVMAVLTVLGGLLFLAAPGRRQPVEMLAYDKTRFIELQPRANVSGMRYGQENVDMDMVGEVASDGTDIPKLMAPNPTPWRMSDRAGPFDASVAQVEVSSSDEGSQSETQTKQTSSKLSGIELARVNKAKDMGFAFDMSEKIDSPTVNGAIALNEELQTVMSQSSVDVADLEEVGHGTVFSYAYDTTDFFARNEGSPTSVSDPMEVANADKLSWAANLPITEKKSKKDRQEVGRKLSASKPVPTTRPKRTREDKNGELTAKLDATKPLDAKQSVDRIGVIENIKSPMRRRGGHDKSEWEETIYRKQLKKDVEEEREVAREKFAVVMKEAVQDRDGRGDKMARASELSRQIVSGNEKLASIENRHQMASEPAMPAVFRAYGVHPYVATDTNPFSTFSIDTDTASYTLMRRYIQANRLPPPEAVRTEEFVNFFDADDTPPKTKTFAIHKTCAPSPFSPGLRLLRIGVKGKRIGRDQQRPAMLTFAIDTSGSMNTPDRIGLVRRALTKLMTQLDPVDQVAIVQFGSKARLVLDATKADQTNTITQAIASLQISGSTHLEDGLSLAYHIAAQHFISGGMNRVLLLSDGATNLGEATASVLVDQVASFRKQGIFCSVFGFGIGTYNDVILETLANRGDGTYHFIDSEEEVERVFVQDLGATLYTIAADVKIQVEFSPKRVKQYRQIGYENRQLKKQDFRNDTVDAGEIGSGQSVTALYEVELQGDDAEDLGVVRIRYRNLTTGKMEEIESPITAQDLTASFDKTPPRFRLIAAAAEFAEILRGSPYASDSNFQDVAEVLRSVALELHLDPGVQEFLRLVQASPGLSHVK